MIHHGGADAAMAMHHVLLRRLREGKHDNTARMA
jgi:hypothetical protein